MNCRHRPTHTIGLQTVLALNVVQAYDSRRAAKEVAREAEERKLEEEIARLQVLLCSCRCGPCIGSDALPDHTRATPLHQDLNTQNRTT